MDSTRRTLLTAGAAAAAVAAARAFAQQQTGQGAPAMRLLAPKAEVSMFPWKEPKDRIPLAVRQIRSFLRAHRPVTAAR